MSRAYKVIVTIFIISLILSCAIAKPGSTNTDQFNVQKDTSIFHCEDWKRPSDDEAKDLLSIMRPLTSYEWHHCYGDWNCKKEGIIFFGDTIYNFSLDAAGFMILFNDNEQLYFGCYTDECWSHFPSGAGSDCDSLGNSKE